MRERRTKSLTDVYIKRPVLGIVVSMVIILAGLQAINSLSLRQYPESQNAAIKITTTFIGADAETIQGTVTTPIEQAVAAVEGVDYIQSTSEHGLSIVNVRLTVNYEPVKALSELGARVDQVRNRLPENADSPVLDIETADRTYAAAYFSFQSATLKHEQVTDVMSRVVQPRLLAIPGVHRADIIGGKDVAMRIWLLPERMATHNVSPSIVHSALEANNFLSSIGKTQGPVIQVSHSANTALTSVKEFENLVIVNNKDTVLRIRDIAEVELGRTNQTVDTRYSKEDAVFLGIWAAPDSNVLEVLQDVRDELSAIEKTLPKNIKISKAYDSTEYMDRSIAEISTTLVETVLIVTIVVFLFIGSLKSALIPLVAIPISLLGTVFLMQLLDFSLNLLTLLAIVLAVGLVVDDAIVVLEKVDRNISAGLSATEAALKSARELLTPVISMTITLIAVYIPIGFMGGITGSLFREFAFTLACAVAISAVVAMTLSPIMSARLISTSKKSRFTLFIDARFNKLCNTYSRLVRATLSARPAVYIVWISASLFVIPLFLLSAKELAPPEDQGIILGVAETPPNSTMQATVSHTNTVSDAFFRVPETDSTFQVSSATGGFGGMVLAPWEERSRNVIDIWPEVRLDLNLIPGVDMATVLPPALPGGGEFPVEIIIASTASTDVILSYAKLLKDMALKDHIFVGKPRLDTQIDRNQAELVFDRSKAADLGLTMQQLGLDVSILMGGRSTTTFQVDGRTHPVLLQVKPAELENSEQLQNLYVGGFGGSLMQLGAVASIANKTMPRTLNRFQQLNAVKISGVTVYPLDSALQYFEDRAAAILPSDYVIDYTGESRQLRKEGNQFILTMAMSMILIFLVLAAQLNNFRDPLIILAGSVPLAMFGALLCTFMKMPNPYLNYWSDSWTTTLNIYSQIGLITLIGLVSKNAILMVEQANTLQLEGLNKLQAITSAATIRLRPILMTTIATVIGHFPLVLVTGPGAEARHSIGLILVVGMIVGTLFTLFVIPSIYCLIAQDRSISGQSQTHWIKKVTSGRNGYIGAS